MTAEQVLALLEAEPLDVHQVHRLVALDAGRWEVRLTVKVARVTLGPLVDIGTVTRERRDGEHKGDVDGAVLYRHVGADVGT